MKGTSPLEHHHCSSCKRRQTLVTALSGGHTPPANTKHHDHTTLCYIILVIWLLTNIICIIYYIQVYFRSSFDIKLHRLLLELQNVHIHLPFPHLIIRDTSGYRSNDLCNWGLNPPHPPRTRFFKKLHVYYSSVKQWGMSVLLCKEEFPMPILSVHTLHRL